MNNSFDDWNRIKQKIQSDNLKVGFKNRDIFYIKMGKNIGYEQDGKGNEFVRPVLILKGFSKDVFLGIPLSTKIKEGIFYFTFEFKKNNNTNIINNALLSQVRLFSTKRLLNKIGIISKRDFEDLKIKFKELID